MTDAGLTAPSDSEVFEQVVKRVGNSKTSFYLAMRLLPEARRRAMFAIYAFCRDVDDIADEPAPQEQKHQALDRWRVDLTTLYSGGHPKQTLARALAGPIHDYDLRQADFLAVIEGMQTDADHVVRAPSLDELDLYCERVASAVGRLSVRIFGCASPRADDVAEHLGKALQLTNILRDIDEDASRGRLYLPREILAKWGIEAIDPAVALSDPALNGVCQDVAKMAEDRFRLAYVAMQDCPRGAMRPARMMGAMYHAILRRLVRRGWNAPRHEVKLSKATKILTALFNLL